MEEEQMDVKRELCGRVKMQMLNNEKEKKKERKCKENEEKEGK